MPVSAIRSKTVFPSESSRRNSSGAALVLVLSILVLMAGLVLAFFISVNADSSASKVYATGVETSQLAATATNIVMAQFKDGTAGVDSNGGILAWASQPGMLRTWNAKGDLEKIFKLYSSPEMVVKSAFDPTADIPPADWKNSSALYTDLNSPVLIRHPNGTIIPDPAKPDEKYNASAPIIDPGNLVDGATLSPPVAGQTYDTNRDGKADVEGFSVVNQAGYDPSRQISPTNNPVPMPVKWLYVLQDGTVSAATAGTGNSVTVTGAKSDNPIVGRVAFWTDDESCKININTASEGVFWDTPRMGHSNPGSDPNGDSYEWNYVAAFPANGEYQRTRGHPAMTCLSSVFGWLLPRPLEPIQKLPAVGGPPSSDPRSFALLQPYYCMAPRISNSLGETKSTVNDGGTYGGTVIYKPAVASGVKTGGVPLVADADRLYTSIDELTFQAPPNGAPTPAPPIQTDRASPMQAGKIDKTILEQSKFFITAASRAPEVNLFNRPRIGLWPIQSEPGKRNVKDALLAFCTSIGKSSGSPLPYYFQRLSTWVDDTNPGSYGSASADYDQVQRNRELYRYLQNLTGADVPGFGGNFLAKYQADRDQILTELFDFIRSTLNLSQIMLPSVTNPKYYYSWGPPASGSYDGTGGGNQIYMCAPVPIKIGDTQGFGRFGTVCRVNLLFFRNAQPADPTKVSMQAVVTVEPYCVSNGYGTTERHNAKYEILGLEQFKVNGASMGFPNQATNWARPMPDAKDCFQHVAASNFNYKGDESPKILGPGNPDGSDREKFPFYSAKITLPAPASSNPANPPTPTDPLADDVNNPANVFDFTGGTLTLNIRNGFPPYDIIQSLKVNFPATKLLVPKPVAAGTGTPADVPTDFSQRMARAVSSSNTQPYIRPGDTLRFVEMSPTGPHRGDMRLQKLGGGLPASSPIPLPESYFFAQGVPESSGKPGTIYYDKTQRIEPIKSSDAGKLIANADYLPKSGSNLGLQGSSTEYALAGGYKTPPSGSTAPVYLFSSVPFGLMGANSIDSNGKDVPGDWDNGTGNLRDGPFINKPDEADARMSTSATAPFTALDSYFETTVGFSFSGFTFSPNRQIASPVAFGSLSSGAKAGIPWRTLLFCANPAAGDKHFGFGQGKGAGPFSLPPYTAPPDHLLLDLFTMPVIEPYPISEPLSTAGKINMNYQLAPFSYIKRSTGVHAVLKAVKILAIPTLATSSNTNKPQYKASGAPAKYQENNVRLSARYDVNADENSGTLRAFEDRFNSGDIFRSASEICSIFLVPKATPGSTYLAAASPVPTSYAATSTWWDGFRLTGDNSRESPYNQIYPRLTTKSNTFTVHMRVQVLKKRPGSTPAIWDDAKDVILSEYRGSSTIERYIDPNDPNLPDFATRALNDPSAVIDKFYRFRVVSVKRFAP